MQPSKCRILYVDDHEDTSFMLTHLLGQSDYEVVTAPSVERALELVREEKFDLYVLDKRLPDGSGLDLCRRLNALTPDVPVIFYSGDAYELHRQQGMDAGANAYVTKPNVDKLVDKVHDILSEQQCSTAVS
ncbi:MAG: response regulator [Acidobacteriota bacterium]|nr:response regulator [Acidobacteriota bacterium]